MTPTHKHLPAFLQALLHSWEQAPKMATLWPATMPVAAACDLITAPFLSNAHQALETNLYALPNQLFPQLCRFQISE